MLVMYQILGLLSQTNGLFRFWREIKQWGTVGQLLIGLFRATFYFKWTIWDNKSLLPYIHMGHLNEVIHPCIYNKILNKNLFRALKESQDPLDSKAILVLRSVMNNLSGIRFFSLACEEMLWTLFCSLHRDSQGPKEQSDLQERRYDIKVFTAMQIMCCETCHFCRTGETKPASLIKFK